MTQEERLEDLQKKTRRMEELKVIEKLIEEQNI